MREPTPGPWKYERDVADKGWDVYVLEGATDRHIANVADHGDVEDAANARLISAAPDLLSELEGYSEDLQSYRDSGTVPDTEWIVENLAGLRAAIKKAKA